MPCYFNLLQQVEDDLEPSTRNHTIPFFWPLILFNVLLLYLFATTLICTWYIVMVDYVNEMLRLLNHLHK